MAWLIRHEPEAALAQALGFAERSKLPAEWLPLIESHFSAVGGVEVIPVCGPESQGAELNLSLENGAQLRGRAWGGWLQRGTQRRTLLDGVALDGWAAVDVSGIRPLAGREAEAAAQMFAPASRAAAPGATGECALIAGRIHRFSAEGQVEAFRNLEREIAQLPGPETGVAFVAAWGEGVPPPGDDVRQAAGTAASAWTETPKSVLVLNTVFPDNTTAVGTQAEWQAVMTEVSNWISANSYGKTNLITTVPPGVFTLPSPVSTYEPAENYGQIMSDAKALALAAGYNSANYDITVVAFPHLAWSWAGRASVSGGNHWLNGTRSAGTIAHEFGHNYGLWHASSWDVNDGTIMPATGAPNETDPRHIEYGDRFSAMGSNFGDYPAGDFSPHGKNALNWLVNSQVQTVSAPGTYRIYRFDHAASGAQPLLALKLQRGGSQTFWLGYRRNFTANAFLSNGAYLLWQYTASQCRLLDMTPDSSTASHFADKEDAALAIGRTFTDPTASLYITPLAQGGSAPNEWLDVRVEFTVAGNRPPTASIIPPASPVSARSAFTLSASASDPDNDPLSYVWDFGNGQTAGGATVNWTFLAGGSRSVALRVSDGKGGLAEVSTTLSVSDPLAQIGELPLPDSNFPYDGVLRNGLHVTTAFSQTFVTTDGDTWRRANGIPTFSTSRMALGADRIVAVGDAYDSGSGSWFARTSHSGDGTTWTTQSHGSAPPLNSVAHNGSLFAAVGDAGTILTSPDGASWTPRTPPVATTLYDVAAAGASFVACGQNGLVLTSPDGITWTQRTPPSTAGWLRRLAVNAQQVAAVGDGQNYWWSDNGGVSWTQRSFGLSGFNPRDITFGAGLWVAVEDRYVSASASYQYVMAVSTDGQRWDLLPVVASPSSLSSARILDGRLWLYGPSGKVLRSGRIFPANQSPVVTPNWPASVPVRTAVSFSLASSSDADGDPVSVLWETAGPAFRFGSPANLSFLLGGSKTVSAWGADGRGGHTQAVHTFVVADPLLNWSNVSPSALAGNDLVAAACGTSRVVLAGGYASVDSTLAGMNSRASWTKRNVPLWTRGLAWRSAGGFIAAGEAYDNGTASWRSAASRSADGQTWGALQFLTGSRLVGAAASDTAYVAVGSDGVILRSTDGQSWSQRTSGTTSSLYGVAFSGARGLAVGSSKVLRSEDGGLSWEDVSTSVGAGLNAWNVFAAGGQIFIHGNGRLRLYNPVSRVWQDSALGGVASFGELQSLVQHGSVYVAVGLSFDSVLARNRRYLFASQDGVSWEGGEMSDWPQDIAALVSCGGNLAAGGDSMLLANTLGTPGFILTPTTLTAFRGSNETGALGAVQVGNAGAGVLNWTVSSNAAWLGASPGSGTASLTNSSVTVQLLSARPPGAHSATLTFSAPGVASQAVTVSLTVFTDDFGSTQPAAAPLTVGSTRSGSIQHAEDSDWFFFDLNAPGSLSVWTTGTLDSVGELHGESGFITTNDEQPGNSNFRIDATVLPGRYWVKVDGFATFTGAYQLQSSFTPAGPPFAVKTWSATATPGQWQFTVATAPGYRYHVQHALLPSGPWAQLGAVVTAAGTETILTATPPAPAGPRGFFRIIIQPP
jgi:hypothetical protein